MAPVGEQEEWAGVQIWRCVGRSQIMQALVDHG